MPVLEVRGLSKRYGRTLAVDEVDLTVEPGSVYGLLGPNGSGKTTTMACALGLLAPTAGRVSILGVPARRIHQTRGRVAALFDDATLVPGLSVRQNLEYARRLLGHSGGRSVDAALDLVGIADLARQRAGGLSLGQGRRLSIARVLLGEPRLIVLDEPLSGLDTVGVLEVLELFRRLSAEGVTLVVSSHRMHELERVVTHVGILLGGRMVRESTLEELLESARGRVRVATTAGSRARAVVEALDGVASVEVTREGEVGELFVELGTLDAADLNRALVEAGCAVTALVPEGVSLQAVFEGLIRPTAGTELPASA